MVKKGAFTLELLNVETDEAFHEHTAQDGETYVEVEPDSEYFIRVTKCIEGVVVVKIFVDGKYLGYRGFMKQQIDKYGLWTCKNLTSSNRALKFCKAINARRSEQATKSNNDSSSFGYGGTVEVRFIEAISNGFKKRKDSGTAWRPKVTVSGEMHSKRVKTNAGTSVVVEKIKETFETYSEGRNLCIIKINYATTVDLIHNNILPKPPHWDLHRLQYAKPTDQQIQQPTISPTNITTKIVENGCTIAQKERELFDLTAVPDSDSNEELEEKHSEKYKEEINLFSTNDISTDERNKLLADIADIGEDEEKKMGFII